MSQVWVVIGKNGKSQWVGDWKTRVRHRFPVVDENGFVWLDERPYVHDPTRDIPDRYPDKKLMGIVFVLSLLFGGMASIYIGYIGLSTGFLIGLVGMFFIGSRKVEDMEAYWRENEPAQMNMADIALTPGSVGMTGDYIREFGSAEHIRQALNPESNWLVILAIVLGIIGVISLIAAVAIMYSPK